MGGEERNAERAGYERLYKLCATTTATAIELNWFYHPGITEGDCHLFGDEFRHGIKVLRKTVGDELNLIDGKGTYYTGVIREIQKDNCRFDILKTWKEPAKEYSIHIALAPTKNQERLEWFVEKSIEMGIDAISFIKCQHAERSKVKQERIDRIAISALKQSGRATLPIISPVIDFKAFIEADSSSDKFIAYVDQGNPNHLFKLAKQNKTYTVLIGPEGDFAKEELDIAIEKGYRKISLGNNRLRTETAALAACHTLTLLNVQ